MSVQDVDRSPVAVVEHPESTPPWPEFGAVNPRATQYEVTNLLVGPASSDQVVTASRPPERWLVYMVTSTAADTIAVAGGRIASSGSSRHFAQSRAALTLPGRGDSLAIAPVSLAAPVTVVIVAVSNLPLEIRPA